MILVTGSSGRFARLVIENLLRWVPADQIVAIARYSQDIRDLSALGLNIRRGDYERSDGWDGALVGVTKVLLISSPELGVRIQHHANVLNAVRLSKSVRLVAYTSLLRAEGSRAPYAREDLATERMLRSIDTDAVMLRQGWSFDSLSSPSSKRLHSDKMYGCASDGEIAGAALEEYAEAAARVMALEQSPKTLYEFCGDVAYTMHDVATALTVRAGRSISYNDISPGKFQMWLAEAGVPMMQAVAMAMSDVAIRYGDAYSASRDLSRVLGRPTATLRDVLSTIRKESR